MSVRFRLRRLILAMLGAVLTSMALGACVSLLPKQPPVQLYQFGQPAEVGAGPASSAAMATPMGQGRAALGVILAKVVLPPAAQGDALLTTHGEEIAYIAGARWVTPAALMFQADARRAFADHHSLKLLDRGDVSAASVLLSLDVTEFDVRYDAAASPPRVVVSVRATLASVDGRRLVQRSFTAIQPATQDRVSAIVSAYDRAAGDVLMQVVGWTDTSAPDVRN